MTRISVCMATYNGERFIEQQLHSILIQLGVDDEVIISDDSSTDRTVDIIRQFKDPRIHIYENQSFRSPTLNFANALQYALGEYIFLSDQDDVWKADKVQVMLETLREVDLVINNCDFIDENGSVIYSSYFDVYHSGPGVLKNFIKSTYLGNCMAFDRRILKIVLPFPEQLNKLSKFSMFHDGWIGLVADLKFRIKFVPQVLSSFRRHGDNASPTGISAKSPNSLRTKLLGRWLLLIAVINRIIFRI
ncbi:glycosyltransferase family 2 protein [Spirosoma jeollabukense]